MSEGSINESQAPEQLLNEVTYSCQADIYSLGMEIISRQQPYADIPNEAAVIAAILTKRNPPKRPENTIPENSQQGDALWSLLGSCWSWNPKDRPEARSVAREIETIKSKGLLVKSPETSTSSSSPTLTPNPNAPETKRRAENLEWEREPRKKQSRPEMDRSAQIPTEPQRVISKAKDMLNGVACLEGRVLHGVRPIHLFMPQIKYGVDDLTNLLSEIRAFGIEAPETAQLELLSRRVSDFQQKAHCLLGVEVDCWDPATDTASLGRLEVAIGRGLRFQLSELPELEWTVASLELSRDLRTVNVNDLTLNQAEDLVSRGQGVGLSFDHGFLAELARKATSGREWKTSATSILAQPRPEMRDLDQLLVSAHSIPAPSDMLVKLTQVWLRGREHERKVEACLRPPDGTLVEINNATEVAATALGEAFFPAAEELRVLSDEAHAREKTCEVIMTGRFIAQGDATVFDEVRAILDEGKAKFGVFHMPWFEDMARQLAVHDDWITRLPWARPGLSTLDSNSVVRDLTDIGDADIAPPTNEACTCICLEPVVVGESEQDTEVAQCNHCLVMFHAKCIEGSCPFCDDQTWNGLMGEPPTFKLHHLISLALTACKLTQHYSPEYRALRVYLSAVGPELALTKPIVMFIKQLSRQESPDPAMVPQIRHLMRKLSRIQFEISPRPEVFAYGLSLTHLHRQMTRQPRTKHVARRKPKFVFKAELNFEASDGSSCLCDSDNWDHILIQCNLCQSEYHYECVAVSSTDQMSESFVCPLCLLKEGKSYKPADVRVTYHDDDPEENSKFVDVKACLDSYSWKVIRRALPPPVRPMITVELFLFIPGTNPNVKKFERHTQSNSGTPAEPTSPQRVGGGHSN
ncbi:hypothetical protein FRC12_014274 [Ceratobasidium sp. 428]|nr:hypothetical protein FRC12_014274 [Ceratobasidium sp. 428]